MARLREFVVALCGMLCVTGLLLGTTYTYVARTLFNAEIFARRVADGLAQPALTRLTAEKISDEIVALHHDILPYRPLVVMSVERVVNTAPFRAVVRKAVKEAHKALMSEAAENLTISVDDLDVIIRGALAMQPNLAEKIPAKFRARLTSENDWPMAKRLAWLFRASDRVARRAIILLAVGLGAGAGGIALARRKDRFLLRTSLSLTVAAFVVAAAARFGAPVLIASTKSDLAAELVRGLWPAFVSPLALRMVILGALGLLVAAAVTSTLERVDIAAISRVVTRATVDRPSRPGWALLRGILFAGVGLLAALQPMGTLQVIVVLAAGVVFFLGVQEMFSIALSGLSRVEALAASPEKRRSLAPRIAVATVICAALIAAGVLWLSRSDAESAVAQEPIDACNGHPELCDRRLNQVAFATTHNSMSAGDISTWMFPNQEKGIRTQLEDGVRGFLIDVHNGVPVGDVVKTLIEDETAARAKYEAVMGKEAVEAAMRIRDRLAGEASGPPDIYLCHGFCELGHTPFVTVLEEIREFLVMNPGEVVVIMIQDEGVTPADVASCFERSGLDRLVYRGPVVPPWPTLREMVDNDERVLVLAENQAAGVPWYHLAYEVCQETPYGFKDASEFSNKPNRGGTAGSLLLMNHWIESTPTPLPSNAEIVNAYDFLLKRARACRKERRMMPNLIAVDFYRTGDLSRVVDALNGVEQPAPAAP